MCLNSSETTRRTIVKPRTIDLEISRSGLYDCHKRTDDVIIKDYFVKFANLML